MLLVVFRVLLLLLRIVLAASGHNHNFDQPTGVHQVRLNGRASGAVLGSDPRLPNLVPAEFSTR